MGRAAATVLAGVLAAATVPAAATETPPRRIVSMNVCTDQFVLLLADRAQIAGLGRTAEDPHNSAYFERAAGLPKHRARAEEVLALKPDLVVTGGYARRETNEMLERLKVPMLHLRTLAGIADIPAEIRRAATAFGHPERGEEVAAAFEARLARIAPPPDAPRPTTVVWRPGGYVPGKGWIVNDVLTAAGFDNLAARLTLRPGGQLPLETLVTSAPDVIVHDSRQDDRPTLSRELVAHPALARMGGVPVLGIPVRWWLCSTPAVVDAAETLAEVRAGMMADRFPGTGTAP